MELTHPVVEVLPDPVAMADQLAQLLAGDLVVQGGGGPLLHAEAGEADRVDTVGFGAVEVWLWK